ncbi:hypothetical protein BDE36_1306 [Arcticibacter tournemirensis]|uniref:Uncharacterized protein n=1 Tax=Arcticibacter tournemirensis TaxID=699437 RepID=A0A5M9GVK6_9SPHI|nr:hypothetical protein [Arcticibacter tournemirensis]KAA8476844.1 hypothetical protein F1649_19395 [Arcticibacter tournemirensis]TQM49587.1 hypothetical protein BDE36_1306 [Arcticibacter tournemirensis]
MYRKTHFKARPDLYQELSKEFGAYFSRMSTYWKRISARYPRQIFILMLASILLSGVLAFTVMRVKDTGPLPTLSGPGADVTQGFGQIIGAGQALKKVLDLQNQINIVLHKDSLTAADSLLVKNAIRQLEIIHHELNVKPTH